MNLVLRASKRLTNSQQPSLSNKVYCHIIFRATGISGYLETGRTIQTAQAIAALESPMTTKPLDRTKTKTTQDEIQSIRI